MAVLVDWHETYRYLFVPRADPGPDGWELPGFDDAAWPIGQAGFGDEPTSNGAIALAGINTPWPNVANDLLLRKTVVLHGAGTLTTRIDDAADVYVDGAFVGRFVLETTHTVDPIPDELEIAGNGATLLAARVTPVGPDGFHIGEPRYVDFYLEGRRSGFRIGALALG